MSVIQPAIRFLSSRRVTTLVVALEFSFHLPMIPLRPILRWARAQSRAEHDSESGIRLRQPTPHLREQSFKIHPKTEPRKADTPLKTSGSVLLCKNPPLCHLRYLHSDEYH